MLLNLTFLTSVSILIIASLFNLTSLKILFNFCAVISKVSSNSNDGSPVSVAKKFSATNSISTFLPLLLIVNKFPSY